MSLPNTSNSMKTRNVGMSYQTLFFPSHKLHPQKCLAARLSQMRHFTEYCLDKNNILLSSSGKDSIPLQCSWKCKVFTTKAQLKPNLKKTFRFSYPSVSNYSPFFISQVRSKTLETSLFSNLNCEGIIFFTDVILTLLKT